MKTGEKVSDANLIIPHMYIHMYVCMCDRVIVMNDGNTYKSTKQVLYVVGKSQGIHVLLNLMHTYVRISLPCIQSGVMLCKNRLVHTYS